MLTEICQYLKNWFNHKPDGSEYPKYTGDFTIDAGEISGSGLSLSDDQYFRIMGSLFNDGVHKYGDRDDHLKDEIFNGAVWLMAVPPAVISLAGEIAEWQAKYGGADSAAMSPYNSESFGGYSYSKSGGSSTDGSTTGTSWKAMFASRLSPWRKI